QERQRRQHALEVLAGQAAVSVAVAAEAEEYRIKLGQQRIEADVAADLGAEAELHPHAFEDLAAGLHDRLVELEAGDAELQQAADLLVAGEHGRLDAGAGEAVGAG